MNTQIDKDTFYQVMLDFKENERDVSIPYYVQRYNNPFDIPYMQQALKWDGHNYYDKWVTQALVRAMGVPHKLIKINTLEC